METVFIKIAAGVVSTLGFGILFKLKPKLLPYAVLDGLAACIVYFLCSSYYDGDFLPNALAALSAALLAELFARIVKAPSTVFLLPGVIVLVPGGSLYYAMSNLISQNYDDCIDFLLTTLKVGIAIGGGIIASSFIRYLTETVFFAIKKSDKLN